MLLKSSSSMRASFLFSRFCSPFFLCCGVCSEGGGGGRILRPTVLSCIGVEWRLCRKILYNSYVRKIDGQMDMKHRTLEYIPQAIRAIYMRLAEGLLPNLLQIGRKVFATSLIWNRCGSPWRALDW